ncbi:MAG: MerR family transcriptional regulator [Flavobacteriia bacterium]|jgi:MerR family copper efflux transcriptional regulator
MLINELSKITGISVHTIRFYEKSGLIKGTRKSEIKSNNYFHYDEEAIEKLELIRDAKSVGFTISEIGELMDAWYNNKLSIPEKLIVLDEKLVAIKQKIKELKEMKKLLKEFRNSVEKMEC